MKFYPRPVRLHTPLTTVQIGVASTPVMALTQLDGYVTLFFVFINESVDPLDIITVLLETSEDGSAIDGERTYTLEVPAGAVGQGMQRTLELGPDQIRKIWRVSATCPTGPKDLKWLLRVVPRM